MAFSFTGLTAYVEENWKPIMTRTMFGSQTGKIFTPQPGIKTTAAINNLTTTAQFQNAATCTRTPSGTTNLSHRLITVGHIGVFEDLCLRDLDTYWTQKLMKPGSISYEALPSSIEAQYADMKADIIAQQLEIAYWQGSTTSWDQNLMRFDGFIKIIDAAGTPGAAGAPAKGNSTNITAATGITAANVNLIVRNTMNAIPARIRRSKSFAVYCGSDVFAMFAEALVTLDATYGIGGDVDGSFEMYIPGTKIKLIGLDGLTGTNRLFAGVTENFVIGTDMLHEEEKFEMYYSKDDRVVKFNAEFKAGVQVAFPDEIVSFVLA